MAETAGRVIEGAFIKTGTVCNLNCIFCPMSERKTLLDTALIEEELNLAAGSGCGRAILVGGEPLLHRDFLKIALSMRKRGLKLGLVTNGRMFVYGKVLQTLTRYGLDSVIIGLNSHIPEIHDAIVKTNGACSQTLEALKSLFSTDILIEVRAVIVAANSTHLNEFTKFVAHLASAKGNAYLVIAYGEPSEGAFRGNEDSFLSPAAAAEKIKEVIETAGECGLKAYYEGIPDCLMEGCTGRNIGLFYRTFTGASGADSCIKDKRFNGYSKPLLCSECMLSRTCAGIPSNIMRHYGFQEVRPVMGVRSNSFDYTEERESEGFIPSAENCSGRLIELEGGPTMNLFLYRHGKTFLYRTNTNNFTLEEINEIKTVRRQLYIDISDKVVLDDYQKDVRQLKLMDVCVNCPESGNCANAYEVRDEIPFYREERWLKGELARMRGRILDIGCGDLRYQDIIGKLASEGTVEYHGLDPDREALKRLKESRIKMQIHVGNAEDFDCERGYFDYILMLRSFNHFYNLNRVFSVVTKALRNYGILIMTDCLPFALLRSKEKTEQAHTSLEPKFEHYRNWSSEQVLAFMKMRGLPFRVNIHRPVQPKTGNMWLLKMIKIEE